MAATPMMFALAFMAMMAQPAPEAREWSFRVLLEDREVGTHTFRVAGDAGGWQVESDARFSVKVFFVPAYRYVHRATERWENDCLRSLEARTNDNGTPLSVSGVRRGDAFQVVVKDQPSALEGCVSTFAYWNPAMLDRSRLLNPQTGEYVPVRVDTLGAETVLVRGRPVLANRYALRAAAFRIDVWYTTSDRAWVQLETRTGKKADGRRLRYLIK